MLLHYPSRDILQSLVEKVTHGFGRRDAESLARKTTNAGDSVGSRITQITKDLHGQVDERNADIRAEMIVHGSIIPVA